MTKSLNLRNDCYFHILFRSPWSKLCNRHPSTHGKLVYNETKTKPQKNAFAKLKMLKIFYLWNNKILAVSCASEFYLSLAFLLFAVDRFNLLGLAPRWPDANGSYSVCWSTLKAHHNFEHEWQAMVSNSSAAVLLFPPLIINMRLEVISVFIKRRGDLLEEGSRSLTKTETKFVVN
jgi:hypothetical protein